MKKHIYLAALMAAVAGQATAQFGGAKPAPSPAPAPVAAPAPAPVAAPTPAPAPVAKPTPAPAPAAASAATKPAAVPAAASKPAKPAKPAVDPADAQAASLSKVFDAAGASLVKALPRAKTDSERLNIIAQHDARISQVIRGFVVKTSRYVFVKTPSMGHAVVGAVLTGRVQGVQQVGEGSIASQFQIAGAHPKLIEAMVNYLGVRGEKVIVVLQVKDQANQAKLAQTKWARGSVVQVDITLGEADIIGGVSQETARREAGQYLATAATPAPVPSQPATPVVTQRVDQPAPTPAAASAAPGDAMGELQSCAAKYPGQFIDRVRRDACQVSVCKASPALSSQPDCLRLAEMEARNRNQN